MPSRTADTPTARKIVKRNDTVTTIDGLRLRLSFSPQAIREHFRDNPQVHELSETQLAEIGEHALHADQLYEAFHRVLVAATIAVAGFDPNEETDDVDTTPAP